MGSIIPCLTFLLKFLFFCSSMIELSNRCLNNPNSVEMGPVVRNGSRTAYHFQPLQHWMNDPNAPMYYNGTYHLFYQYNPNSSFWMPNLTWGHSVSTNLINWTILKTALSPSKPFDINGCWSGSATILHDNKPVILHTSLDKDNRQVQSIAYPKNLSDPYLREWIKPDCNPVIEPFDGLDVDQFRDPTTAWFGPDELWRILIGIKIGDNGLAILYKSRDFVNWTKVKTPFYHTNGSGMWECIDFFPVGMGKYLLKVSFWVTKFDKYMLGRYDEERDVFVGDDSSANDYRMWKRIDYGTYYASKTFHDKKKQRRILWGWSNETDSLEDDIAKGWAGVQTIPRVLSLDADGETLIQWPVEEVELLRMNEVNMQNVELQNGGLIEIKGVSGSQADVEIEFELPNLNEAEQLEPSWVMDPPNICRIKGLHKNGGIGPFGLLVLASENWEEYTAISFRIFKIDSSYAVLLCAGQIRSSIEGEANNHASGGFVNINITDIDMNGKISLRTLIDHSVVESYANKGRTCITSRVYSKSLLQTPHLYVFNNGSETVKISDLKAWDMAQAQIS